MPHASLYLALNAILLVVLSYRVMKLRRGLKIALGEGPSEDWRFRQARAAHQNSLENGVLSLFLLFALEALGLWPILIHLLGLVFFGGRIAYVHGLTHSPYGSRGRVIGMVTAWGVQLVSAVLLLILVLLSIFD